MASSPVNEGRGIDLEKELMTPQNNQNPLGEPPPTPSPSASTAPALVLSNSGKRIDQAGKMKYVKQMTGCHNDTELHLAAQRGDLAAVKQILTDIDLQMVGTLSGEELDAEVAEIRACVLNEVNELGETALFTAADKGHLEVVKELLKYSSKECTTRKNRSGFDPLHIAAMQGHHAIVQVLLDHDPSLSQTYGPSNATPLVSAASRGHTAVVNELLSKDGSLLEISRSNGKNALHLAAREGHVDIVRALLEKDPQLARRTDKKGQTALHMAVKGHSCEVVKLLLNADATIVMLPDKFGNSALHVATRKKRAEIVNELLFLPDTNVNALTRDHKTALDIAEGLPLSEESTEIKECLARYGAVRANELNQPRDELRKTVTQIKKDVHNQHEQTTQAVFELDIHKEKFRAKVLKSVLSISGVMACAFDGDRKTLTVKGDFDSVALLSKLRKIGRVSLVSVGPVGEKNKDDPKEKKEAEIEYVERDMSVPIVRHIASIFSIRGFLKKFKDSGRLSSKKFDEKTVYNPDYSNIKGEISVAGGSKTLERQTVEAESDIDSTDFDGYENQSEVMYEIDPVLDTRAEVGPSDFSHVQDIADAEEVLTQSGLYKKRMDISSQSAMSCTNSCNNQGPLMIIEEDIIRLKFIHGQLNDTERKCLINCALCSLNQEIESKLLFYGWMTDGLVDAYDEAEAILEAEVILETLIRFNLLYSEEERQFVKLPEIYRYIILDQFTPPEYKQFFLMQYSKGLTEPPETKEWEKSREVHLMDNELSQLPEDLKCPNLQALFLQGNYKLRMIPSTFFNSMPSLQVLNLSRTRIKFLPESLFRLVNLKSLFLSRCDLLMALPSTMAELKSLEVLDLEGTEIVDLPEEVEQLTNLTCLKLSFCEPITNAKSKVSAKSHQVMPWGIMSALSQLKVLHIDVSPYDERWNTDVEAIFPKVCGLRKLRSLKFYFPRVELLSHPEVEIVSSLAHFKFTVGHHVKRIISRIPHDAKIKLEQYDKLLRYVNGTGVPMDVKWVLGDATAFHLDRHASIKMLSEFGFENMVHLECCVVGECNELQAIHDATTEARFTFGDISTGFPSLEYLCIYCMKNLRTIWEGKQGVGLSCLKHLTLRTCMKLTTIFMPELLANLFNLEELTVDDCPAVSTIARCHSSRGASYLPNLKKISLQYLPELANISCGIQMFPILEQMTVYDCPVLKSLPIKKSCHTKLQEIKGEASWWEELKWEEPEQQVWGHIFVPIDEI